MKRTIIVLVLVVVVILVATPFVNGVIMERVVYKAVEDFNTMSAGHPAGISYEVVSYGRGYSTTEFEWKIDMGTLKNLYGIESVIITEHARHGYSGVVSTMGFEKNAWFNDFIDDKLQGQNPLHIQTCYSFFGGIESTMALDPFSTIVEGETLEVKGGKIITTTNRELKNFSSSGSLGGMAMGDTLAIGEMSIESDIEMISTFVWDGEMSFGIKDMLVSEKDKKAELKNLAMVYGLEADEDVNTMAYSTLLTLESLQANGQNFSDGSIRFSVNGIKMDAYEAFMKEYLQVYSRMMSMLGLDDMNTPQNEGFDKKEMAQVQLQMMGAYEKLLKKDFEIRISDLNFLHATGEAKGEITLRLLKDMTFAQFAPALYQPRSLLEIFHLESDFRLPAQLIGANPKLMTPLFPGMQTGVFVKDEDMLSHRAETKDGTLFLNGKELNLGG